MQKSHCVNIVEEMHSVEITLCQYRQRRGHWAEITLYQHHRRHSRRGITKNVHSLSVSVSLSLCVVCGGCGRGWWWRGVRRRRIGETNRTIQTCITDRQKVTLIYLAIHAEFRPSGDRQCLTEKQQERVDLIRRCVNFVLQSPNKDELTKEVLQYH